MTSARRIDHWRVTNHRDRLHRRRGRRAGGFGNDIARRSRRRRARLNRCRFAGRWNRQDRRTWVGDGRRRWLFGNASDLRCGLWHAHGNRDRDRDDRRRRQAHSPSHRRHGEPACSWCIRRLPDRRPLRRGQNVRWRFVKGFRERHGGGLEILDQRARFVGRLEEALDRLGFSLVELAEYVRRPLRIVRIDSRHNRLLSGARPGGCGSRALLYEEGSPRCSWRVQ